MLRAGTYANVSVQRKMKEDQLAKLQLVSCHEIAGIWVAFFQECQQYRCGQEALGLWSGVLDEAMPWVVEDYKALKALEGNRAWSAIPPVGFRFEVRAENRLVHVFPFGL